MLRYDWSRMCCEIKSTLDIRHVFIDLGLNMHLGCRIESKIMIGKGTFVSWTHGSLCLPFFMCCLNKLGFSDAYFHITVEQRLLAHNDHFIDF